MSKCNCKCNFKVGDYVIGNEFADDKYFTTRQGWVGKVVEVREHSFIAEGLNDFGKITMFTALNPRYFELYDNSQPSKIVITHDGKTTTAKMYRGMKLLETTTAECHPDDRFDFVAGARVAFDRLVGEKKDEPAKPTYYNGKVVCVDPGYLPDYFTKGKIYTFVDGQSKDDKGNRMIGAPVINFDNLVHRFISVKWLEVVE